ncbi:hypothetical protein QBC35DRAFT_278782 [Podospora australis]|uniref:Chromo domain-containing protein n=1 Tax=Podospora australis TaxID=1536484 RepID=A0AAN7AKA4_9PEZI|nr:hypothetical protein QBC35DRAFT_278782 [Podospora australis]
MPFVEDPLEPPLMMVQSDLQESVEAGYYSRGSSASLGFGVGEGAGPTVVTLDDHDEPALNEQLGIMPAPVVDTGQGSSVKTPASANKRGRPSRSSSAAATPVVASSARTPRSARSTTAAKSASKAAATPRSAKSAAAPKSARSTGGRKRKSEEIEPEPEQDEAEDEEAEEEDDAEAEPTPAAKRARAGRPARAAAARAPSARLAAKAANKPKRGHPKSTATATAEKKPKGKGGRPKKSEIANGAAEYEVEAIVNVKAEGASTLYEVKWKGFPADQNTWEPKKNLGGAKDLLKEFDASQKKSEIEEAAKKASTAASKKEPAAKAAKPAKAVKKVASRARTMFAPRKADAKKAAAKPAPPARTSGRPLRSRK